MYNSPKETVTAIIAEERWNPNYDRAKKDSPPVIWVVIDSKITNTLEEAQEYLREKMEAAEKDGFHYSGNPGTMVRKNTEPTGHEKRNHWILTHSDKMSIP